MSITYDQAVAGMAVVALTFAPAQSVQAQSVEAVFQGTYQVGMMPRPKRNPSIGDLIAGAKPQITNQGGMTFRLKINGVSVTGTVEPIGLVPAQLAGTMKNGVCKLLSPEATYEGKCNANGFTGKISGFYKNGRELKGEFETMAITFEDVTQRNAAQAAQEQQNNARRAELEKRCNNGSGSMEACIELDQMPK